MKQITSTIEGFLIGAVVGACIWGLVVWGYVTWIAG